MKGMALVIIAAFMLTQSFCYLATTDKSRVLLKSTPPPDVTTLHIAVYDATPDNLLLYQVFAPGDVADLEVPSGENRIFVIWGETSPGVGKYYGVSSPMNVGGDNEEVNLTMALFDDKTPTKGIVFNTQTIAGVSAYWNVIYGADNYEVINGNGARVCFGPETACYHRDAAAGGELRAYSSIFNLISEKDSY